MLTSLLLLLVGPAQAGEFVADVKVPARLSIDGEIVAEVYRESLLRVPYPDGDHKLVVTTEGVPKTFPITIDPDVPVVVLVGRSGTTVGSDDPAPRPMAVGESNVRFRVSGRDRLMVQVGKQRILVSPGSGVSLSLAAGEHDLSVRSPDGTTIFTRGVLTVSGGTDLVVQLAEGKLPETAGEGLTFNPVGP